MKIIQDNNFVISSIVFPMDKSAVQIRVLYDYFDMKTAAHHPMNQMNDLFFVEIRDHISFGIFHHYYQN